MIQIQTELSVADNTGAKENVLKFLEALKKVCFSWRYCCDQR